MKTSTPETEKYDLLVLGSGEGGKYIAWTMARKGMKTAVIERKYIGGSCPNIACLPSKNVIHSAKVASLFFRSRAFPSANHPAGLGQRAGISLADALTGVCVFGATRKEELLATTLTLAPSSAGLCLVKR